MTDAKTKATCSNVSLNPPVRATMSLCCNILRAGWKPPEVMHDGMCSERHGGQLGRTYYLTDCGLTADEVMSLANNVQGKGPASAGPA